MITLVITIVIIIILSAVAINGSTQMIDESNEARKSADAAKDDDEIRAVLMRAITDNTAKVGVELVDGTLIALDSGDREYGSGYYIIPGGKDDQIDIIKSKAADPTVTRYKKLSASYIVDYAEGTFVRVEEVRFK